MSWFADLSPCFYLSKLTGSPEEARRLLAVGWLDIGHEFPTGSPPEGALARLKVLLSDAWCPLTFMGGHTCSLCLGRVERHAHPNLPSSYGNLLVPGENCVYVTTQLITHYVEVHQYARRCSGTPSNRVPRR